MTHGRDPWIDWMKAIGITLIVVVHVATKPFVFLTPPIYAKQLGVGFFMFVLGYSLARERRPVRVVLVRRLFDVYFWGLLCALVISAVMLPVAGTANLSNYLPFVLGVNVLFDHFPANPTTWYIGMYLHALLAWALVLHRVRVSAGVLLLALVAEVAARAWLSVHAGRFVAYMNLTNWLTVFLLGSWAAARQQSSEPGGFSPRVYAVLLIAFAYGWYLLTSPLVAGEDFPWLAVGAVGPVPAALVSSGLVSGVYIGFTWLAYGVARAAPALRVVEFLARNTLLVFILHMPIYYVMLKWFAAHPIDFWVRSAVLVVACLPVLALLSQALMNSIPAGALRARVSAAVS
jgi:peptidoglycan/LPS O-acetylase OafA/YrhL